MKKYSELLDTPYQKEMLSDIQYDLKKYYPNMESDELQFMSNEIYVVSTLMYNKVDLYSIIQFLYLLDNNCDLGGKKDGIGFIETAINDTTSIHLKTLVNKYIKETQRRLKN